MIMKHVLKDHLKIKNTFVGTRKEGTLTWFTLMNLTVASLEASFFLLFSFFPL